MVQKRIILGAAIVVIIIIVGILAAIAYNNHQPSTCPLCGNKGLYLGDMNGTEIYGCMDCGIHFFSKKASDGTLIKFYYSQNDLENGTIIHNKTYG